MKKVLGITVTVIIIVVILVALSKGFGFGGGGLGTPSDSQKATKAEKTTEAVENKTDETQTMTSKVIIVKIKENQVYVDDKAVSDKDALKTYIEELNSNEREFRLKEENSIQATYEWVADVFDELKIPLVSEN